MPFLVRVDDGAAAASPWPPLMALDEFVDVVFGCPTVYAYHESADCDPHMFGVWSNYGQRGREVPCALNVNLRTLSLGPHTWFVSGATPNTFSQEMLGSVSPTAALVAMCEQQAWKPPASFLASVEGEDFLFVRALLLRRQGCLTVAKLASCV